MKLHSFLVIGLVSLFTIGCTDNNITDMGTKIQPEGDKIVVDTATVNLSSENFIVPFMYSRPDSLLLGTFVDEKYGTTYADILTQVQPPLDFSYPAGSVADSAKLIMYYYSWFGDSYSPMVVNIFEMNKGKTFGYSSLYQSNIDVDEYTDQSVKIGSRIFTAKDAVVIRPDTTTLEFPLTDSFVKRFSPVLKSKYTDANDADFQKFFNGMYITTNFGSASMLYLRTVVLKYFFHYSYQRKTVDGLSDSTVVVNSYVNYPANREVRQINRFQHPDVNSIKQSFDATPEINLVSSPANIYTKVTLPFSKLKSKTVVKGKTLLINRAVLKVDVSSIDSATLAQPLVKSLLLIKESEYDDFFKYRKLPTDSTAILSSISYETDSETSEIHYYYSFNLAPLITRELKKTTDSPENIKFVIVPVSLQYDGNSSVIQVKHQNLMSAVQICSGTNKKRPMKLNVVYSGF